MILQKAHHPASGTTGKAVAIGNKIEEIGAVVGSQAAIGEIATVEMTVIAETVTIGMTGIAVATATVPGTVTGVAEAVSFMTELLR